MAEIDYHPLIKAKYSRREPKPGGGYRYFYDEIGHGPQQGGRLAAILRDSRRSAATENAIKEILPRSLHTRIENLLHVKSGAVGITTSSDSDARRISSKLQAAGLRVEKQYGALRVSIQKSENTMALNPLDLVKGNIHPSEVDGLIKGKDMTVSSEISHLVHDKGYPQKRAVAAALEMERRGKISKGDDDEGEEEEEEEEDPAEAEAKKEEELGKADINPLDLIKAEPPTPRAFRQGSVIYVSPPAYEGGPMGSRPDLGRPRGPEYEKAERDGTSARDLVRYGDGTLTHPTGVRRRDDDA